MLGKNTTSQLFEFLLLALTILFFIEQPVQAQIINNVEVRAEGLYIFDREPPDSVFARVEVGKPFTITWRVSVNEHIGAAQLGFKLYSPDGSITSVAWNKIPQTQGIWTSLSVFQIGGVVLQGLDAFNGTLPSTFMAEGISIGTPGSGFGPTDYLDFITATVTFSEEGIVCLDSTSFSPSARWWVISSSGPIVPQWGGAVGGYPDGGFCIEIATCNSCDLAGDANDDGAVNVADLLYMFDFIFNGGKSFPCFSQGDADGDGKFDISDALNFIKSLRGGPALLCAP